MSTSEKKMTWDFEEEAMGANYSITSNSFFSDNLSQGNRLFFAGLILLPSVAGAWMLGLFYHHMKHRTPWRPINMFICIEIAFAFVGCATAGHTAAILLSPGKLARS